MRTRIAALAPALLAVLAAAAAAQDDKPGPDDLKKLAAEFDAAVAAGNSAYVVAPVDPAPYARRALAMAGRCSGDERVPFLAFAALHAGKDRAIAETVVKALRDDHAGSPRLAEVLPRFRDVTKLVDAALAREFLAAVIAQNKTAEPRAWALYLDARRVQADKGATEEAKAAAKAQIAEAAKLADGTPLGDLLTPIDQRLQVGAVAPDIAGNDTDGTPFELSDYRGKVVVLDFWGDW
jgi:hypothetical protein